MSLQPGGIGYSFGSVIYPGPSVASGQPPYTTGNPTIAESGELLSGDTPPFAGARFALTQPQAAVESGGRAITYEFEFDAAPTAFVGQLQGAMRDVDSEYVTLGTITGTGTGTVYQATVTGVRELFVRLRLLSDTVGSATTIIGKILG